MKMKVLLLRDVAVTLVSTVSLLVIVGSIMNMHNDKYSRSRNTSCSHGILILNQPDSHVCCTSMDHSHSWICSASFDVLNSVISSKWAFFIPLLPLLANVVFANGWNGNGWYRRLGVYLALFLLRTVVLYLIPYYIQEWAQRSSLYSIEDCWCKDFVSATKCQMHFDFSDHIVLNVVQYMLPCILEIHFSLCSILGYLPITTSAGNHAVESSESNEKHNTSNVASGLTQNGSFGTALLSALYTPRAELISLFIAFALLAVSARSLLLTCMFFHTYAENAVGLLIALTVAGLPLYSKNVTNLWVARVLQ